LRQVAKGEIADLKAQFGEAEENRHLRARFLEELLTGSLEGFKVHRRGINIAHGVVAEALDLENAEIAQDVSLDNCLFQEEANFRDARFQRHLFLNECQFSNQAIFHRIKVEINLFFRNAVFQGPVDFVGANIGGQFNARGTQFQGNGKENETNFNHMKVGQDAFLREAVFQGPVDFGWADIGGQFSANGAQFQWQGKDNKANFNAMKVGQSAFFRNAVFQGPVDFGRAAIARQFNAEGVQFLGQGLDNKANFNGMKVAQDVFLDKAVFQGRVDFGGADIGGQFSAEGAQFQGQGKDNEANFNGMKVGHHTFFRQAVFQGPVDFGGADIGGQFSAEGAQFQGQGPDNEANFNSMNLGQSAFFSNALFQGPVDFVGADIGRHFRAEGAQFQGQGPDNEVKFNSMKVGQGASFNNCVFQGPVDFVGADIRGQFNASEAKFENENGTALFSGLKVGDIAFFDRALFKCGLTLNDARLLDLMLCDLQEPVAELSLERTVVGRELSIKNATVGKLKARNLEVKVNAALEQVTIQENADWRDSSFQALNLHEVTWPANKDEVWLEGLTYKAIYAGDEASDWEKLLAWVQGSRFNTQNYSELEAYFARCGHRDRADKVFIWGKRRAWGQRRGWSPAKWGILVLWDWLAGYGRKPGRVVLVGLALFLLGAWIYDPGRIPTPDALNNLGLASDNWLQSLALRGIYSLYGLLSAIPGWAGQLELKPADFYPAIFLWVQRLCGWILIPIGLAAVYTRLK